MCVPAMAGRGVRLLAIAMAGRGVHLLAMAEKFLSDGREGCTFVSDGREVC